MISLRSSQPGDLAFITALERHPENRELIGQWPDEEHVAAIEGRDRWSHWIIERDALPAGFIISRDCRSQGAGIYVKRVLVAEKERGTGRSALERFLEIARERYGPGAVWLIVRQENARAQAVYRSLGFERFDPQGDEARRFDSIAEAPADRAFRMRRPEG